MLQRNSVCHFSPPMVSHQNGVTERFFRSARKIFQSLIGGECTLNEFNFLTLLTEVERILNDRPITRLPSEPDDLAALTPSMLLTGCLADGAAPGVFLKADGYRRSWRKQDLAALCWERWLKEYLHLLQPRSKWHGSSPSLKPGEVVLIMDENTKRNAAANPRGRRVCGAWSWRISASSPGKNGWKELEMWTIWTSALLQSCAADFLCCQLVKLQWNANGTVHV